MVGALYARLIDGLLETGDVQGAEEALTRSGFDANIPPAWQLYPLMQSRARLRLAQGLLQAAIDDARAGHELLTDWAITDPAGTHCRSTAALALARIGRHDEAQQMIAGKLSAARRFGAHTTVGISLRTAGLIERGSSGIERLREAVTHLERSPARLEYARALADLGAALRRAGKRRDAQQALRLALDLADRCGGSTIAAQARAELLITGERPR
jgi:tetratricopeptide (TPR) repeat protein